MNPTRPISDRELIESAVHQRVLAMAAESERLQAQRNLQSDKEQAPRAPYMIPQVSRHANSPDPIPQVSQHASALNDRDIDPRSVYINNVHFAASSADLHTHFQDCGPIDTMTICHEFVGLSRGFAYIEFADTRGVAAALRLDGTTLLGRKLKISPKRINVSGMSRDAGGARGRGSGSRGGYPYLSRGGYKNGADGTPH